MNGIANENRNAGTHDWGVTKPANSGEIEGFASATSVFPGEIIKFYVRSKMPKYSMAFYRMGWYDGKGGRFMHLVPEVNTIEQPEPEINELNKVECFWNVSYELVIPDDWCTGFYICKLSSLPESFERYIIFVVKPKKQTKSTYLLQIATNTYNAYNMWGGHSLYGSREAFATNYPQPLNFRARVVSFNRPFQDWFGSGDFFNWEYQFIRWAEKNGLDLAYCSNQDLHEDKDLLKKTNAFICPGHDEYWTKEMYDQVEETLENGNIGLGFFNANPMYWQSRFEESYNGNNRNMVCYKCIRYIDFQEDPMYKINPSLVSAQFRDGNIKRPEQKIVGQMYEGCFINGDPNQDLVFQHTNHWLFKDTGIEPGERFPKLLGYEYDRVWAQFPKPDNLIVLTRSPVQLKHSATSVENTFANVTVYTKSNLNTVFAAGTSSWSWSLDDYLHDGQSLVSVKLQKLTMNILKFISKQEVDQSVYEQVKNSKITATIKSNDKEINNSGIDVNKKPLSVIKNKEVIGSSKISKPRLLPFFVIVFGVLGFLIGYMQFEKVLAGVVIGVAMGLVIGRIVDKVRNT